MSGEERPLRSTRRSALLALALCLLSPPGGPTAAAEDVDLINLSIEELMAVEVTSVSKRAEAIARAPAAVTVLGGEDIRRSGITRLPELLRMVPGLHVAHIDANKWAITARGFGLQYANKLLVLIDGRSIYDPAFSGVYWDVQDVMLEDVERIEVVRGPGGTLWGANAVNGVINIITKKAADTRGWLASGASGTLDRALGQARYGGSIGEDLHYRLYTRYFERSDFDDGSGGSADDDWRVVRGGLRIDWDPTERDAVTLQGDYYSGKEHQRLLGAETRVREELSGGNVLARWNHSFPDGSNLHLQSYYDRTERDEESILTEKHDMVDVELEHRFGPLRRHDVVVGAGYRMVSDEFDPIAISFFSNSRTDHLVSGFVQDQITLIENLLTLTVGSKFEHNDYTGFEYQPSGRVLFTPHPRHSLWAAISRAVKTPSRVDADITAIGPKDPKDAVPPIEFRLFNGSRGVDSDKLLAYELGYRGQPLEPLSLEVAAYYFDYHDLRNQELLAAGVPTTAPPACSPPAPLGTCTIDLFAFDNKADARAWGIEASATWIVNQFWKLTAGYTYMNLDVDPDQDSTDPLSDSWGGETPVHQFHLLSRLNLPWNLEFDSALYWVDRLETQPVGDYARLDLRLGWRPVERVELSVVGQNLAQRRHAEFKDGFFSARSEVPRSAYAKVTWRY